jgi:DNA polymerase-3 subunit beta
VENVIQCPREQLARAFRAIEPLQGRSTISAHGLADLVIREGRPAQLIAMNGDMHVWQDLEATGRRDGSVLLPIGRVSQMLKALTGETVEIEIRKASIKISDKDRDNGYVIGWTEDNWPEPPTDTVEPTIHINAGHFLTMMERVLFACDTESTKYALSGICLDVEDNVLRAVATDTRRLVGCFRACLTTGERKSPSVIIPLSAVRVLQRMVPNTPADINLHWDDRSFTAIWDGGRMRSKSVDGRFPAWESCMPAPESITERIELPSAPLKAALNAARVVHNAESHGVDLRFRNNVLTVIAESTDGKASMELPVCAQQSEQFTISIDPKFVLEWLATHPATTTIVAELQDSESGMVLRPQGADQMNEFNIVMPLSRDR